MSHEFSRPELYQLVWSEPLRKLAPRFSISDVPGRNAPPTGSTAPARKRDVA
jgi:hypothetical protein